MLSSSGWGIQFNELFHLLLQVGGDLTVQPKSGILSVEHPAIFGQDGSYYLLLVLRKKALVMESRVEHSPHCRSFRARPPFSPW